MTELQSSLLGRGYWLETDVGDGSRWPSLVGPPCNGWRKRLTGSKLAPQTWCRCAGAVHMAAALPRTGASVHSANLFMMFAPPEGWRHVDVTDRHSAADITHMLKDLSDTHFLKARKIVLMEDDLNTQRPASLYEAFTAVQARRLVERFEWHYTPKLGSWLKSNSASCRVSVSIELSRTSRS
jgi:hypothetical protein